MLSFCIWKRFWEIVAHTNTFLVKILLATAQKMKFSIKDFFQ